MAPSPTAHPYKIFYIVRQYYLLCPVYHRELLPYHQLTLVADLSIRLTIPQGTGDSVVPHTRTATMQTE